MRLLCGVLELVTTLLRCIRAFFRSRNEQALVELALRQQLATYAQKGTKPRMTPFDRAFWVFLSQIWSGWKETLAIVQPDTVVRWHRKGFKLYWQSISKRGPGRPPVPLEVQALIRRFTNENDWRVLSRHSAAHATNPEARRPGSRPSLPPRRAPSGRAKASRTCRDRAQKPCDSGIPR